MIDTPGFGDYVNNREAWTPIVEFIDDQHESYMRQEQQPLRKEKQDMRIHACLYFIRPTGYGYVLRPSYRHELCTHSSWPAMGDTKTDVHSLKPLDIETMKRLGTRVNLIPIIAKADTMTPEDLQSAKIRVCDTDWAGAMTET